MHRLYDPFINVKPDFRDARPVSTRRAIRKRLLIRFVTATLLATAGATSAYASATRVPQPGPPAAAATSAVTVSAVSGTDPYFKADGASDDSDNAVAAAGSRSIATGANARATGTAAVATGNGASATSADAVAIGDGAAATSTGTIAIGGNARASGLGAMATGKDASANGNGAFAAGYQSKAVDLATATGIFSTATGSRSTAVGAAANASGVSSVAIGNGAQATRANSVALGADSTTYANLAALAFTPVGATLMIAGATAAGEVSVGAANAERRVTNVAAGAADTDAVNLSQLKALDSKVEGAAFYDRYADGSFNRNSFTLGGDPASGGTVIHNVADGVDAHDAVNVAQLNAVSAKADQAATRAESAVTYDTNPDTTVNHDSITLAGSAANGGTIIHNVANGIDALDAVNVGQLNAAVGDAIGHIAVNGANPLFGADGDRDAEAAQSSGTHSVAAGANARATGANAAALGANAVASGASATALGAGASASADNAVALGDGSIADRANTVSVGAAGAERQIGNVAAGVQGTDAVNVNQLNQGMSGAVSQANSYTDNQVRSARRDAYGGTASALAVAGLPQSVLPGHGMVAAAAGTYGGQSAVALGVSQLSGTGKWAYKVQGTASSRGEFGASVGAGMHW
ncbi:Autotransporter adhesin [Paraburkholderia sartisoli]|uniref:Autotransporter adhesin n=1 Tax=Paraburkholderia sartisoli TaxID=83784 RepID=A0A1H4AIU1_9BURK|nr:Autotransporter adhesin [Paraburkholderia sartisoli]